MRISILLKKTLRKLKQTLKRLNGKMYRQFISFIGGSGDDVRKNLFRLFIFAIYSVLLILAINLVTLIHYPRGFGEWGDFFGGVLNPILTFLTFMGLLLTIILQSKELKEARQEAKRSADALRDQVNQINIQSFENTFFSLLSKHNEIIEKLENINYKIQTPEGERYEYFKRTVYGFQHGITDINNWNYFDDVLLIISMANSPYDAREQLKSHINSFYPYISLLSEIVRFVDSQTQKVENLDPAIYLRTLRSMIPNCFLGLVMIECIEENSELKNLIIKYNLLENFTFTPRLAGHPIALLGAVPIYGRECFGENNRLKDIEKVEGAPINWSDITKVNEIGNPF